MTGSLFQSNRSGLRTAMLSLTVFCLALAARSVLVDRVYSYSFEADSPPCIEQTRAFYFFFKHPSAENAPHTLSDYPTYLDGDYIISAIVANVCAPLARHGMLAPDLSDSDDSLVIFSMRWSAILMEAATAVLVLLILLMLTDSTFISFVICVLYYILNSQSLAVDLIRVDHYTLFTASFVLWSSISLFLSPQRRRYYMMSGLAAGMACATKLNFAFYLMPLSFVILCLLYQRHVRLAYFILFGLSFLLSGLFMFQRWLLYPEEIYSTVSGIVRTGEEWFLFWGNKNYFYYLYYQFFDHGIYISVTLFLLALYASFCYVTWRGLKEKKPLYIILCLSFAVQMVALALSPKTGRYGIIIPIWASAFIAIAIRLVSGRTQRARAVCLCAVILMPMFIYSWRGYQYRVTEAKTRDISIRETRIAARQWMIAHIPEQSVISVFQPHVSNPPVYDQPYVFTTRHLYYPFLSEKMLCAFQPTKPELLKREANRIIISDKEQGYHFYTMRQNACDTQLLASWHHFYDSLPVYFQEQHFTSAYSNYGVKDLRIYTTNDTPLRHGISFTDTRSEYKGNSCALYWQYTYSPGEDAYRFEVQIAEDSDMRWLVYGSRDGYISRYRLAHNPVRIHGGQASMVPPAVQRAFDQGRFDSIFGHTARREMKDQFENFFAAVLMSMSRDSLTLGAALRENMNGEDEAFEKIMRGIFPGKVDITSLYAQDYIATAGLQPMPYDSLARARSAAEWQFTLPVSLKKDRQYYWRVRFKDQDAVLSRWSSVAAIKYTSDKTREKNK